MTGHPKFIVVNRRYHRAMGSVGGKSPACTALSGQRERSRTYGSTPPVVLSTNCSGVVMFGVAGAFFLRSSLGKFDFVTHSPSATAANQATLITASESRSATRLPLMAIVRPAAKQTAAANTAVPSTLDNSSQGTPPSSTSLLRPSNQASTTVCIRMPMSEAIASPVTSKRWKKAEYTDSDATTMIVLAIIGVSVSPAA